MRTKVRIADRLSKINPSQTLAITSKAKKLKSEGKDIVNFAAGELDFDTPEFIKKTAIKAIESGFTKYTPATGTAELKKAISEKFKRDNSLEYPPNQIVVSCGAKHSIFNTMLALVNPGDEVLIPSPYWVSYPEMVNLCSGVSRFIKTAPENNFKLTAQELKKNINSKAKVLVLNNPSNPTGCVFSAEELKNIADLCVANNIFIIADEIYEKILYDGLRHISIASLDNRVHTLTITVNGLSKAYSMTGWRIGYLGGPADIVNAISKLQDHSTSNPTSISQAAAVEALTNPDDFFKKWLDQLQKRRDYVVERLNGMKKIKYVKPEGTFYIFCDISKTKIDSLNLANRILDESLVAIIPGAGFGRDDYIRISFATGMEQIKKGMDRIEEWLQKL